MADVKAGRVQVIVGRDLDRLTRKMREIEEFVKAYIDVEEIFDSLLGNKLKNLYDDLKWEFPSLNPNIKKFFAF